MATLGATAVVVVALATGPVVVAAAAGPVQSTVPFGSLSYGFAITSDTAGDLFLVDNGSSQVIELPAGATSATQRIVLPFSGLAQPASVAVDQAGNVFVADTGNDQIVELPAGATSGSQQVVLPFDGLISPVGIAVDHHDNVYVGDDITDRVVELPADATSPSQQTTLPFTGLDEPRRILIDPQDDILIADPFANTVVELPAGATNPNQQTTVPFTGLNGPDGLALDPAGDLLVTDSGHSRVVELPAGATSSSQQTTLPFTGLDQPTGLTTDPNAAIYTINTHNSVDKLTRYIPTSLAITTATPLAVNTPFTVHATVTATGNLALAPTGTVTITDEGTNTCTAVITASAASTGTGSCQLTETTSGDHTLTATYHPSLTAHDSSTTTTHLDIHQPPTFTSSTPPQTAITGQTYHYAFSASAHPDATFSLDGAAPGWLTIDPATGDLTGTVPQNATTFTYSVIATNDVGTATAGPYTVDAQTPPSFTAHTPPLTTAAGNTYNYQFSTTARPDATYSLNGAAPGWLTIDPSTGQLAGTVPHGIASFSYSVIATNVAGTATAGPYTVDVEAAPAFYTAKPPLTARPGATYSYTFGASGAAPLVFALDDQAPSWLTVTDDSNGHATVTGTVPHGITSFAYALSATNDAGTATVGPYDVQVEAPPTFTNPSPPLTAAIDQTYQYGFSATGRPRPTYSLNSAAPGWLTIDPSTGQLSGTVPHDATTFTYSVIATNDAGTATVGPYTVTAEEPPAFTNANPPLTAIEGQAYHYTFAANGTAPLTFALDQQAPSWLTIDHSTGAVSGTVPGGITSFTYSVTASNDVGAASVGPFTVTVHQSPSFTSANPPLTATTGRQYGYTFTATGTAPLTYALDQQAPSWLTVDQATGAVSGAVPGGTSSFTYSVTASNGAGTATVGPFTVTVHQPPSFTNPNPPLTATTGHQYGYTFTATGTAPVTYALDQQAPSWLTIDQATGTVSGTVPAGTPTFTYSVTATNGAGTATAGPYSVAVTPPAPHADVSVKLACPHRLPAGRSKTCTVTVSNTGPQAAANVKADVTLGRGLTGSHCRPRCTWTHRVAVWKLGQLAAGSSRTLTLHITGHRPGTRHLKAAATSPTTDPKPRNNTAAATVSVT